MTHQDPELTQRIPAATIGQPHGGPAGQQQPAPPGTIAGAAYPPGQGAPPPPPWPSPPPSSTAPPAPAESRTAPPRGRVQVPGRWIAAALGAVVLLMGATAAVTLAVAGGRSAPPGTAAAATTTAHPATTGAAAPTHGGQPTVDALISGYVQAVDNAQGEAASRFLCGGTGPGPDTAVGWSWTFVMLHEQLQAGPQQIVQSRTVVPLTVLSRGQQSGAYLAVLDHQSGGWCLLGLGS
jgi:hypothetical protein